MKRANWAKALALIVRYAPLVLEIVREALEKQKPNDPQVKALLAKLR